MASTTKSDELVAYPLVPANTADFESWARGWAAGKGWELLEVVRQVQVSDRYWQLNLRCRHGGQGLHEPGKPAGAQA